MIGQVKTTIMVAQIAAGRNGRRIQKEAAISGESDPETLYQGALKAVSN